MMAAAVAILASVGPSKLGFGTCIEGDVSCGPGKRLPKVAAFCVTTDDAYLHTSIVTMSLLKSMNDQGTAAGQFLDAEWTYFVAGNLSSASIARVTAAGLHASHVSSYGFENSALWPEEVHWWTLMPEPLYEAGFNYSLYIDGDVSTLRAVQVAEAISALDAGSFGVRTTSGRWGGSGVDTRAGADSGSSGRGREGTSEGTSEGADEDVRATEAAALAAVGPLWPAPIHEDSWPDGDLVSYLHRPDVNTGVLFMDNRRLVELSFATRYEHAYMEFLKSDFWASESARGWIFGDQMAINFMARQPTGSDMRLPVALLPPTWNVNCARRVTDFSLCRDAHAYQDASEGTGGPFFFHFTIKPLGPPVCSSKPGRQSERAWKEQVGIPGAGAGVVMSPNTKGTGPGQWTDLVVERNTGYFSDIHRRAWRLWHLQQDLIWGVVYAGMYE